MRLNNKTLTQLCDEDKTHLGQLIAKARSIDELNYAFKHLIGPDLATNCRVGSLEQGVLTIFTDNASWATRIRYQTPNILSKLRSNQQWANLSSIQVKVKTCYEPVNTNPPPPSKVKKEKISPETAQQLADLAKQLEDSEDKEDCQNLVRTLKRMAGNKE